MNRQFEPSVVSNQSNPELLLIRVGHRLMQQWRKSLKRGDFKSLKALDAALLAVWRAKAEWRAGHRLKIGRAHV